MELTVAYLREQFEILNKRYFEGRLPIPRITVSRARRQLGQFSCRRVSRGWLRPAVTVDYHIKVSDYYDMPEQEYQQTLLHEMIHYYIAYTGARDTSAHGRLFRQQMERLNDLGCHITISQRVTQWPVRNCYRPKQSQRLLIALRTVRNEHFVGVINPVYKQYVDRQAQQSAQVSEYHWIVSNDQCYAEWPRSRSLRGHRITADDYRHLIEQ